MRHVDRAVAAGIRLRGPCRGDQPGDAVTRHRDERRGAEPAERVPEPVHDHLASRFADVFGARLAHIRATFRHARCPFTCCDHTTVTDVIVSVATQVVAALSSSASQGSGSARGARTS
ncbi:hypothetical protein H4W32_005844 [Actinophytocola algeriensis]|uniref:Uncharacterized protein n=1 Tax=Actinophytocola algeriensis TaxID=1768010 RepID=A0A7W7Q3H1_9PSEU|nr:hypothetical protein [Actinophytocola algeriensis]MBE1477802.1 hypothetical protein [Actinophytocola algeriensis]